MKNILVLNGHPNPDDSTAGKAVLEAFRTLRPDAKVRTLAALSGSDGYDVAAEQAALVEADVIAGALIAGPAAAAYAKTATRG